MQRVGFILLFSILLSGCGAEISENTLRESLRNASSCRDSQGIERLLNEKWVDECNRCTCRSDGYVVCTQMACQ